MTAVSFEAGVYGVKAIPTVPWSESLANELKRTGIAELELNDAKGWRGKDLSFLKDFTELRALKVIDLKMPSVDPIHWLRELRVLEMITYCKTKLCFEAFPHLEECALEWRPGAESLFDCLTLKCLFVNRYTGTDTGAFSNLVNLESLSILNAPVEYLTGLSSLVHLRSLRLANLKHLATLQGIENLTNLEELEINTCPRIESIEQVAALGKLRKFHLINDGAIASLGPLKALHGLESVMFYESTNVLDGDLSPLLARKNLLRVSFQNRRHYTHRREDFGPAYTS